MDTEKIMRARTTMQILLNAQETLQGLPVEVEVGEIVRQIDEMIIGTAAQMDIAYGVSKKPETPYNSCDECEDGILKKENAELKKQFEDEYGKRTPTAPTGNSIARALGTTSEALFGFRLMNVV